ncbi:MAG: calcium/sodium antiporter [Phycisphaerales bacterium]
MVDVLLDVLILAGGIVLLIVGGDLLVRGAVTLSLRMGVAPLVIGLTVVAFGTSAPELALNMIAAGKGNTGLAFGNIVGSNIANIGLIIGLLALLKPLKVNAGLIKRELPIMMFVTVLALVLGAITLGTPSPPPAPGAAIDAPPLPPPPALPGFSVLDGLILLAAFVAFLVWTIRASRSAAGHPGDDIELQLAATEEVDHADLKRPLGLAIVLIVVGLALLIAGGQGAEIGASGVAAALGMSNEVIGLTVVAVATSLPELFAGLMAIRRNQVDIAVGNVVGSNIFNLALVLGATALIAPVPVPQGGIVALGVMTLLSLVLIPMCFTAERTIARVEGAILLLMYAAYTGYLIFQAI